MIKCQAWGCPDTGRHYAENPTTHQPFYLCGEHMNRHALGNVFVLDTKIQLVKDEPAAGGLTPAQVQSIVVTTEQGTYTLKPKETSMAYSILSTLTDARDEIDAKLEEARNALQEIESVISELEDAYSSVSSAIDTIEELDGLSINTDVELTVDVSVYL